MNEKYKCKDCNEEFTVSDDKKYPNCESLNCHAELDSVEKNIEKKIPMFFGMNPPTEDNSCEGGVCSFDKK